MRWGKDGYLSLGIAIGFFGAVAVFVWLIGFSRLGYCQPSENAGACTREWVAALSGWIAAGAAGVTLVALYAQLTEQRKQTDFVLGEHLPTIDAYAEDFIDVYLRVVNWNRRALLIDEITCTDVDSMYVKEVMLEHKDRSEHLYNNDPRFFVPIRVAAFDDRSRAPAICRIELQTFSSEGPKHRTFQIHGRLLGEHHRNVVLSATAFVKTVASGP